jgi:hypothetical protein
MQLLLRLMAVLLVLTTGGVFQTLAFAAGDASVCTEDGGEHGDEGETDGCADCTTGCGLCLRCPQLATPGMAVALPARLAPVRQLLQPGAPRPVVSAHSGDIFQPPRA